MNWTISCDGKRNERKHGESAESEEDSDLVDSSSPRCRRIISVACVKKKYRHQAVAPSRSLSSRAYRHNSKRLPIGSVQKTVCEKIICLLVADILIPIGVVLVAAFVLLIIILIVRRWVAFFFFPRIAFRTFLHLLSFI